MQYAHCNTFAPIVQHLEWLFGEKKVLSPTACWMQRQTRRQRKTGQHPKSYEDNLGSGEVKEQPLMSPQIKLTLLLVPFLLISPFFEHDGPALVPSVMILSSIVGWIGPGAHPCETNGLAILASVKTTPVVTLRNMHLTTRDDMVGVCNCIWGHFSSNINFTRFVPAKIIKFTAEDALISSAQLGLAYK